MKKKMLFILVTGITFTPTALAGQMSFRQMVGSSSVAGISCPASVEMKKRDRTVAEKKDQQKPKAGTAR